MSPGYVESLEGLDRETMNFFRSKGVVFITSAGNNGQYRANIHPRYSNVIVAAAGTRWRPSPFTEYGHDVSFVLESRTVDETGEGTSFSAPRLAALIPLLGITESKTFQQVMDQLRQAAEPMGNNRLFRYGLLGAGSLDPTKILKDKRLKTREVSEHFQSVRRQSDYWTEDHLYFSLRQLNKHWYMLADLYVRFFFQIG